MLATVGNKPEWVTTDGYDAYPRAIRRTLGRKVEHRTNRSLNNRVELDRRAAKQCYYPMRGFRAFASAAGSALPSMKFVNTSAPLLPYCQAKALPLPKQRRQFPQRLESLIDWTNLTTHRIIVKDFTEAIHTLDADCLMVTRISQKMPTPVLSPIHQGLQDK
ncbi:MAG: DDE-type integrase/transposase/recombinase [Anaerolineae bacterium]|nr:DDE-type integrase/transposase/recombinase [Anaerolineae bacterium]